MALVVVKNMHQKEPCYNEIGLVCAQNIDIILEVQYLTQLGA